MFAQETKVCTFFFSLDKFKFGFHNTNVVDCEAKSEGLAILWKKNINFEVLNFSVHHIRSRVSILDEGNRLHHCALTEMYGHHDFAHRNEV